MFSGAGCASNLRLSPAIKSVIYNLGIPGADAYEGTILTQPMCGAPTVGCFGVCTVRQCADTPRRRSFPFDLSRGSSGVSGVVTIRRSPLSL